jgi:hypothetical protein
MAMKMETKWKEPEPTLWALYLPMQLTDWLLVDVALLLIDLTQNLFDKIRF